jgi:hypothetical protein
MRVCVCLSACVRAGARARERERERERDSVHVHAGHGEVPPFAMPAACKVSISQSVPQSRALAHPAPGRDQ